MEKLLALLAKGHFTNAENNGDEEIVLNFYVGEGGIDQIHVDIELDSLADLNLKNKDGSSVDFSDIYREYGRDADGNEVEDEDEEPEDA